MDALSQFLDDVKKNHLARGHFLGLLHILIGRRIEKADGTLIATGLTWRDLAAWLKKTRWDQEYAKELGQSLEDVPPRDRQKFWYSAIARAKVDSTPAQQDADRLAKILEGKGYKVGPPPKG